MLFNVYIKIILVCVISLFSCSYSLYSHSTQSSLNRHKNMRCIVAKELYNNHEPETFNLTNNLLRKYDEIIHVNNREIIIQGRILDEYCNPVADSKVLIWHLDSSAKYPYQKLREGLGIRYIDSTNNKFTFIGSGTAYTNNQGEFTFITMYPGKIRGNKPYISLRVEGKNIGKLHNSYETKVFLSEQELLYQHNNKNDLYFYNNQQINKRHEIQHINNLYYIQFVIPTK